MKKQYMLYWLIPFFFMSCGGGSRTIDETDDEKKIDGYMVTDELNNLNGVHKGKSEDKTGTISGGSKQVTASGLKAGFADDNKQYNYFVNFQETYRNKIRALPLDVSERILIHITDRDGKPVSNADIKITHSQTVLTQGKSLSDGTFLFFPSEYDSDYNAYTVSAAYGQETVSRNIERKGRREVTLQLNTARKFFQQVPLDIVFILDATGSMGEEIRQLKNSIELINLNISALSSKPQVRFGLVAYRDRGDDYVTRTVKLTGDLEKFQKELSTIEAGGGGDEPEDLQTALYEAVHEMPWNTDGIRTGFIITDAPPQLYPNQKYTYVSAAQEAKSKGIKLFSIGCGGLPLKGEYILRQISQYTMGKYIFMHYGEKGESTGGKTGSVSHHTGSNYETDKLEAIVIRFIKEELQHLTDQKIEVADEYFSAIRTEDEKSAETLEKLFTMAAGQLVDYSSFRLAPGTPAALIPFASADSSGMDKEALDYFSQNMILAASRNAFFKLVERQQMEAVLKEQNLQLTDLVDEKTCVEAGKILGARVLLSGTMYRKEKHFEIFIKMLSVETGEILSVTKVRIDKTLGITANKE